MIWSCLIFFQIMCTLTKDASFVASDLVQVPEVLYLGVLERLAVNAQKGIYSDYTLTGYLANNNGYLYLAPLSTEHHGRNMYQWIGRVGILKISPFGQLIGSAGSYKGGFQLATSDVAILWDPISNSNGQPWLCPSDGSIHVCRSEAGLSYQPIHYAVGKQGRCADAIDIVLEVVTLDN